MLATASMLETLGAQPALGQFEPAQIQALAEIAEEVTFGEDEVIFHEGDCKDVFYLIVKGTVAIEIPAGGKRIRIQTLHDGEELGWSVALPNERKYFQARALKPVRAIAFGGERLRRLLQGDPVLGNKFAHWMLIVVSERLRATQLQLMDVYRPGKLQQ